MTSSSLIKPLRFRFTDPEDVSLYGERWYVYDEDKIVHQRARVLMELEQEMGLPISDVMNGFRSSSAMGDMAGAWLAMKLDPDYGDKAPAFQDFNPLVMMIKWQVIPVEDLEPGKEESSSGEPVALEPGGSPDTPPSVPAVLPDALLTDATSPTDTVSLVTMPVSGSATS